MRGGSNQWTCARKSSKDNKLYETISPGEKIQTLLPENDYISIYKITKDKNYEPFKNWNCRSWECR